MRSIFIFSSCRPRRQHGRWTTVCCHQQSHTSSFGSSTPLSRGLSTPTTPLFSLVIIAFWSDIDDGTFNNCDNDNGALNHCYIDYDATIDDGAVNICAVDDGAKNDCAIDDLLKMAQSTASNFGASNCMATYDSTPMVAPPTTWPPMARTSMMVIPTLGPPTTCLLQLKGASFRTYRAINKSLDKHNNQLTLEILRGGVFSFFHNNNFCNAQ